MVVSAVFILDMKGKVLISRNYRGDIPMYTVEKFFPLLLEAEQRDQGVTPVLTADGITYLFIRYTYNLQVMAITKKNSNVAAALLFLRKLLEVFKNYFKSLEEESIKDNFVIIYELLDEMMDFGYPQTTEAKILHEYITQESNQLEENIRPPMAVTNAVSWRSEGIKYRKNEVFLDVIEYVDLQANSNGNILHSEIRGVIKMKCFLTGMPELRLGLNDKILFENSGRPLPRGKSIEMDGIKFHQCVRLSRFENDRTISFIPPDGEFDLLNYRLPSQAKPLIWVESTVDNYTSSRIEYRVKARAQFKAKSTANHVEIIVPVPSDADSPRLRCTLGTATYDPIRSAIMWRIKQLQGGKELLLRAQFGLPSVQSENPETKPPIRVKFEIPYFTTSGFQVRYLKIVEKSGYHALPWVRYITRNGDFHLRLPETTVHKKSAGSGKSSYTSSAIGAYGSSGGTYDPYVSKRK